MTALHVSEGGNTLRAWRSVADLVPPSLSKTILPSVLGAAEKARISFKYMLQPPTGKKCGCGESDGASKNMIVAQ